MNGQKMPSILAIGKAKERFEEIVKQSGNAVNYLSEANFAMQSLKKNDYTLTVANKAPQSVMDAVINIASIGLSLNPATALAYLVPRNGLICLDISYQGLIRIATDSGAIRWAKAELVYSNDEFEYTGLCAMPTHKMKPFSDRGSFVGVYCVAKTSDGDILTEIMTAADIDNIKLRSEAHKAFVSGKARQSPWSDFFGEMTKKTCIKRASKTWPKSTRSDRLQHAIDILNANGEGIDFNDDSVVEHKTREQIEKEQYDALCDLYAEQITAIKDYIANDDITGCVEVYSSFDQETINNLWRSTKRGGCFTTQERAYIHSDRFGKALREFINK